MNQTLHILPLRLVQHSDRTSILSAYSRQLGSLTFAVPAGPGAGAARRRALLMPLNPLEVEAAIRPDKEVHTFRSPRALMPLHGVLTSPVRTSVAMFMAEALQIILRQSEGDPLLYDYIVDAMERLNDPLTPIANFPLAFLTGLASVLGIAPDAANYRKGRIFDMIDACFRTGMPLHGRALSVAESEAAAKLMRISWRNMARYRFTRRERAEALDHILEYYTLHYANLTNLHSPEIFRALD